MGKYHPNLTNDAVLARAKKASKAEGQELVFKIPQAKKKIRIAIVTEPLPGSFDSPSGRFIIQELSYEES